MTTPAIIISILFILCLSVMFYFLRFQYKTTEEEHRKIVAELAERHAAAEAKEDAELAAKEAEEEIQAEEAVKAEEQAVSEPEPPADEEKPE